MSQAGGGAGWQQPVRGQQPGQGYPQQPQQYGPPPGRQSQAYPQQPQSYPHPPREYGPPPKRGLGKGLLAAIAGAAVLVVVAVVVVIIAPWSSGAGAGTDMSTDANGNDVATMTLPFHPGWEWELSMQSREGFDKSQYPNWQDPPASVTWDALDLDAAAVSEITMTYTVKAGEGGVFTPAADAAGTYAAAHLYYHGDRITDNYAVEGQAVFASFAATAPADANAVENAIALGKDDNGGLMYSGGESAHSIWPQPGGYVGFKTAKGSIGYLTVTAVRKSAEQHLGSDDSGCLDQTIAITYFTRA